jgi:hypothetical protein
MVVDGMVPGLISLILCCLIMQAENGVAMALRTHLNCTLFCFHSHFDQDGCLETIFVVPVRSIGGPLMEARRSP